MNDVIDKSVAKGGDKAGIDLDSPEMQAAISRAVDAEVQGLKSKNSELIGKLKDLSERSKVIDALGGEEGVKQLAEMRTRLQQDEDLKLFAEGKHDEYNERITKRAKADLLKQLDARDKRISEIEEAYSSTKQRLQRQLISEQIQKTARDADMLSHAIDDALLYAERIFSLDDEGNIIARNAKGELETGKDGKPLSIPEWVESMRDSRPHWWPAQSGMGARPSTSSGNNTPKSWSDAKTLAEKKAYISKKNPSLADR